MLVCDLLEAYANRGRGARVEVYPDMQGADIHTEKQGMNGPIRKLPIKILIGNEPFKQFEEAYLLKMMQAIRRGKRLPPILTIRHPADPSKFLVLDGNHRLQAYRRLNAKTIPAQTLSHDKIHLALNDYGYNNTKNRNLPLSQFREPDGSYKMNIKRPELDGRNLNQYFAKVS